MRFLSWIFLWYIESSYSLLLCFLIWILYLIQFLLNIIYFGHLYLRIMMFFNRIFLLERFEFWWHFRKRLFPWRKWTVIFHAIFSWCRWIFPFSSNTYSRWEILILYQTIFLRFFHKVDFLTFLTHYLCRKLIALRFLNHL